MTTTKMRKERMRSTRNTLIYSDACEVHKNTLFKKKANDAYTKQKHTREMIFIFISWLLVVLVFAIWMRALHTIPIYTHTTAQVETQKKQLHTLWRITQLMICMSLLVFALHFAVPEETQAVDHTGLHYLHNHTASVDLIR
jgi:ABC-type sugar transport system permease subunit